MLSFYVGSAGILLGLALIAWAFHLDKERFEAYRQGAAGDVRAQSIAKRQKTLNEIGILAFVVGVAVIALRSLGWEGIDHLWSLQETFLSQ
jgi:hypothetical protein